MNQSRVFPVSAGNRISSLDLLRGFAVLGILVMNIQSYSMINQAYLNPSAYGDLTGLNKWIWIVSHVLFDQKFMTIFSILFGAGIILMTRKAEEKTKRSAGFHYNRIFWLFIIGKFHFGPFEWLWRSLTYMKKQPFKRNDSKMT